MRKYLFVGFGLIAVFVFIMAGAISYIIAGREDSKTGYDSSVVMTKSLISAGASNAVAEKLEYIEESKLVPLSEDDTETVLNANFTNQTASIGSDVISENAIVIDVENEIVLAQRDATERISPASMTKILTVLVAAEHLSSTDELDDEFEITFEMTDYSYKNDCSNVGFSTGEMVTVRDLFYGTILPSGADAAMGLAIYTAGSHEAFVELMNEKIAELGLSDTTHFTNCVGIYNDDHYSTVYDMAVILKAAYDNSLCREVLSTRTYTTSATTQHSSGISVSNWFLRRIDDKETNGEVLCAKTGYVNQSGNCAASLSIGSDQKVYICVTAHSSSSWRCIYDHVALYQQFIPN